MIVPSRRTLGAAALIAAGIGAFLVPFLLHSPSTQGTSPTPTTPGSGKNPTTPSGSSGTTVSPSGSGGDNSDKGGSCGEAKSHDPNPHDKGNGKDNGNAYGVVKNKLDTTVALMKSMGKSNPAFHLHHDTDTDNDKAHGSKSIHNPGDHDSSCAAGEEKHE